MHHWIPLLKELCVRPSWVTMTTSFSRWWFQPIWKNLSQIESSPQVRVKMKNNWNHQLVLHADPTPQKKSWVLPCENSHIDYLTTIFPIDSMHPIIFHDAKYGAGVHWNVPSRETIIPVAPLIKLTWPNVQKATNFMKYIRQTNNLSIPTLGHQNVSDTLWV